MSDKDDLLSQLESIVEDASQGDDGNHSDPLKTLVGEGKDFDSVEDLVKKAQGKKDADEHIKRLEEEAEKRRLQLLAVLEKVKGSGISSSDTGQQTPQGISDAGPTSQQGGAGKESTGLSAEETERLLVQTLEKRETAKKVQANQQASLAGLLKIYGSKEKVTEALTTASEKLGMSTQELSEVSARSPSAFFRMMGLDPDKAGAPSNLPQGRHAQGDLLGGRSSQEVNTIDDAIAKIRDPKESESFMSNWKEHEKIIQSRLKDLGIG